MADWTRYRITPMDVANKFEEGYVSGRKKVAGRMAADGDYAGAASTVMPYDMNAAKGYFAVRDYEQQRQERAEGKALNKTIGAAMASGDRSQMESARSQAFGAGQLDQGMQITNMFKQMDDAQIERTRQTYGQMYADMDTLDALTGPEQQAAYDAILERYAAQNLDVSRFPRSWGPNVSKAYRAQMLGAAEALKLEMEERRVVAQEKIAESGSQRADAAELTAQASMLRANNGVGGGARWRGATAQEKEALDLDPSAAVQIDDDTGQARVLSRGSTELTEGQRTTNLNLQRMTTAEPIVATSALNRVAGPLVKSGFGNDKERTIAAAQEQWADAMLRLTTGAAATKEEIDSTILQYMPQPGDGPDTLAYKKRARKDVMDNLKTSLGSRSTVAGPPSAARGIQSASQVPASGRVNGQPYLMADGRTVATWDASRGRFVQE